MNKLLKYDNGLRVVVCEMPGVRSVSAGFWVGVGSSLESAEINGMSHFTEHMMFKGTDELTPFDIANKFESFGANVNAFTGKESTCYYFRSIDEYCEECFDLLSQIVYKSTFNPVELDKERKVIVEEINMVEDSPEDICYDEIATAVYGNGGYGQTILGPIGNVMRYSKSDVDSFVSRFYTPNNLIIALAGNVTLEKADKLVRKYVLPLVSNNKLDKKPASSDKNSRVYRERIKDFEQSNIALAFPAFQFNSEESMTLAALNAIMGGGMSSRLFQSVREQQGLAYSVYTSPSAFVNSGTFNVYLNISEVNTEKSLLAVKNEIDMLLKNGITAEELERTKVQLKSSLVFAEESVQSVMLAAGKLLIMKDEVYDASDKIAKIDAVTIQSVNDLAKRIFNYEKINCAYVGKKTSVDIMKLF